MADHDQGYKQIFSNPRMIEDLLRGFVEQDWVSEVDFSTLERVNASFVSDDLKQREEDMIWRMRLKGEWLYVYLLLEFQSRVDKFMAVRMLTYLGLLYQDLIKSGQLKEDSLLPPVLPLVLYNGRPRWKAPVEIEKLVAPAPGRLKAYQARLRYLLIDEGALKESQLKQVSVSRNLAAVLFALENSHAPEQMEQAVSLLVEWLVEPQWADLRRAFVVC